MTIGELERAAGVTDRTAFWKQFAHIQGYDLVNGKLHSRSLEAGIAQLRWMIKHGKVTSESTSNKLNITY